MRFWRALVAVLAIAVPAAAWGQAAVLQGGTWQQGHVPSYVGFGGSQPIIQDGGPAGGGTTGVGISELDVTAVGTGTPPYVAQGTGPLGTNACDYDAPIDNPTGYHYLCWSANAQGGGLITYGAGGAAAQLPLNFNVNGNIFNLSAASGTVSNIATTSPITGGPITTTGTIACATCGVTGSALSQFASTTSAQMRTILSDETGTGALEFASGALGTPLSGVMTNVTGLPLTTGVTGILPLANGGTNASLAASAGGIFYSTGSAGAVLAGTATPSQCLLSGANAPPTWGSCAGGASVTSIAGNTGAFTLSGLLTNSTNVLQVVAASKSDQQTGSSNTLAVTPLHQQDHTSAIKAWVNFVGSSGALNSSFNVTSVTRSATGVYVINFTTAFTAATNYSCVTAAETTLAIAAFCVSLNATKTASAYPIDCLNGNTLAAVDPTAVTLECTGVQ